MGVTDSGAGPLDLPIASVVVACRNEEAHIGRCLDSLLEGGYPPARLDIIVVDGMSTDGTREIVRDYGSRFPCVRLVDNPARITPAAFNAGVRAARGEVVPIVGSHATYERGYLVQLVRHLIGYGADEAGAIARYLPRNDTPLGRAIVVALSHPFGAGANVAYKLGVDRPQWVDTGSSGCYRRDVFDRVGLFNERLIYSQDIEFNARLRRAGGRILLVPSAVIEYYAHSDARGFLQHTFRNGVWMVLPLLHTHVFPMSWRHFVPMAFVTALLVGAALWPFLGAWPLLLVATPYVVTSLVLSIGVAVRRRSMAYASTLPPTFAALHVTYGLGSIWGLARFVFAKLRSSPPSAAPAVV